MLRSPEQVAERLDRLVEQIKDTQRPFMRGEKPADVLIVSVNPPPLSLSFISHKQILTQ